MSRPVYAAFAQVLATLQPVKDNLEAVLDPETGFAPRIRQICRDQIEELEECKAPQEKLDALRLEENTWALLQALMPARKTEPMSMPTPRELLAANPYTPISTLAHAIMNSSLLLTELIVVREWLQETAPEPPVPEAVTGYWKFTKHNIMQALRTRGSAGEPRDALVKEMDPDAYIRDEGRLLALDDTTFEKGFVQNLFSHIRAGRLEDALELCRNAHQPWKAASIRGSIHFRCPAVANEPANGRLEENENPEAWSGNRKRRLWKSACTRAALDTSLPDYERVLYAALVLTPQTSPILKSACRTWEDHVWAQVSMMCEERQTAEIARLGGGWWEGGTISEKGVHPITDDTMWRDEEEWEREVIEKLQGLHAVHVEEGPPADHAFHISQLHIITGQIDSLLEMYASGLRDKTHDPASPEYPTMTRFFAHLCLFLQMIGTPVPPVATQTILEVYLRVLEDAGQRDLIAMYAGALGDNAVERYASFLTSLELSTHVIERKLALSRAREHGLDTARVAIVTAERTMEKAFQMLDPLQGPLPRILEMQPPASAGEKLLLRSIEWTIFDTKTHSFALEQANIIFRYFLGAGRVQVAKLLLEMLPVELMSIDEPQELAAEYLDYRKFFGIWDTLQRVVESQALESPQMNRETRSAWLKDYKTLIEQAREQVVNLLTSEWLVTEDVELGANERLRLQLIRIRQTYIPELIIRLHAILLASRLWIPGNTRRALELANIVADSRYRLYKDFANEDGRRLGDYLEAVRQAVLACLEKGGSGPFRMVTG